MRRTGDACGALSRVQDSLPAAPRNRLRTQLLFSVGGYSLDSGKGDRRGIDSRGWASVGECGIARQHRLRPRRFVRTAGTKLRRIAIPRHHNNTRVCPNDRLRHVACRWKSWRERLRSGRGRWAPSAGQLPINTHLGWTGRPLAGRDHASCTSERKPRGPRPPDPLVTTNHTLASRQLAREWRHNRLQTVVVNEAHQAVRPARGRLAEPRLFLRDRGGK